MPARRLSRAGAARGRVLVDARPLQGGHRRRGIGTYTRQLLEALIAGGFDDRLALLVEPGRPPPELPQGEHAILPALHRQGNRSSCYRDALLLGRTLRRLAPDCYHAVHPSLPLAAPVPVVVTVHDCIPWRLSGPAMRGERWRTWPERLLLPRATLALAVSQATAADLRRLAGIDAARVRVVAEGLDPEFRPREGAQARVAARFGLAGPYLLHVGALDHRKDPQGLLRAWAAARAEAGDIPLVLAGELGAQAPSDLGGARRLGYVPTADLADLLSAAGCCVVSSRYEGFGLPLLEAMGCGCPVAAYRNSSLTELVGDAGALVADGDPVALGQAAARLARPGPAREAARTRGLARAAGFSWAGAARATIAAYDAVVASCGAGA